MLGNAYGEKVDVFSSAAGLPIHPPAAAHRWGTEGWHNLGVCNLGLLGSPVQLYLARGGGRARGKGGTGKNNQVLDSIRVNESQQSYYSSLQFHDNMLPGTKSWR